MRSPSIVPSDSDNATYIVLDDFGLSGTAYRETDPTHASLSHVVRGLLDGEFSRPLQIVAFNVKEGWSRDVSKEVASDVVDVARLEFAKLADGTQQFVERQLGDVPVWPVA